MNDLDLTIVPKRFINTVSNTSQHVNLVSQGECIYDD